MRNLKGTVWLVEGWPLKNCSIECYFERDGLGYADENLRKADAVFYWHLDELKTYYNPNQINILFASESDLIYPNQADAYSKGMGNYFNISINYHLPTDKIALKRKAEVEAMNLDYTHLQLTYAPYLLHEFFEKPLPFAEKDPKVPMAIFMSNCRSQERNNLVQELMKYLPVDSFGQCFHNRNPIDKGCHQQHYEGKLCAIRQYKFYLSFENSIDESYVTEKYWQGETYCLNSLLTKFVSFTSRDCPCIFWRSQCG